MKKSIVIDVPLRKDVEKIKEEEIKANIRNRRKSECFAYINRGRLWYNKLSDSQLIELSKWYEAWLNATETKVIPKKPIWLDEKLNDEDVL